MVVALAGQFFTSIFGSRNERLVRNYSRRVQAINALEPEVRQLTDAQLRARSAEFQQQLRNGARIADIQPKALAVAREAMDRAVGIRNIFNPVHAFDPTRLDEQAQALYAQVQQQIEQTPEAQALGSQDPLPGWMQVEIPVALYEAVRKLYPQSRPPFRARPFDVQLIGGMVLSEGRIAEMKTGEGKTIVGPLACYVACLEDLKCYVVTVNDYLVQRDRDWVFPFYHHLGLSVGAIHPYHMQPPELKQQAYSCNVVYGTNSEFGFDYLRDNMKLSTAEQVQKRRDFCIIDEVDSILIDEARTPLIISGPAHEDAPRYDLADSLARHLIQMQKQWDAADQKVQQATMRAKGLEGDIRNSRDKNAANRMREELKQLELELPRLEHARDQYTQYYEVELDKKAAHLTHHGVAEAQRQANVGSFYVGDNMDLPHLLENALRAHVIYTRDKEYVVHQGEVVIVDEFTGRLMIGRQWSDGLHQAIEAKEKVKIKEETQTLATVTIQNFFKLFKRLAGMTGTAITESTEFMEIYGMDVVCIPTNVPVVRDDRNDLIYLAGKDKWPAILDEVHRHHQVGRPVLVGTTSVENSEMLSQLLLKKYGIRHEVLNAKQHEREANIVASAGQLGAVMIATNMAGRGTDIKLAPIAREDLVRHWQLQNLLPREATPELDDAQLLRLAHRHLAKVQLGRKPAEIEAMSDEEVRLTLLRHWVSQEAWVEPKSLPTLTELQCMNLLDEVPSFMLHKLKVYAHVNEMGGLHIVGTERHESRRIDNQLRGRAGRQGDHGSSRFFISLDDDLMKLFAGKATLNLLSRFGMKEGDAIEHKMLTKSVERAQRKVEERNYEIRKNLLEYDEVMEYQRNTFYGLRQTVLENGQTDQIVLEYIADAVDDAVDSYLARDYTQLQVAEWCRQTLDVSVDPSRLRLDYVEELLDQIRAEARAEIFQAVDVTLGEYMSPDVPAEEWDLRGLSQWARSRFSVDLGQKKISELRFEGTRDAIVDAAVEQIAQKDLSGVSKYLVEHYPQRQLADWARNKFDIEVDPAELATLEPEQVRAVILEKAREAYAEREANYPVEFTVDMAFQVAQHDGAMAAAHLTAWANRKYDVGLSPEKVSKTPAGELREMLKAAAQEWLRGGRLEAAVDQAISTHGSDAEALAGWVENRWGQKVDAKELQDAQTRRAVLIQTGRRVLRAELGQLERFVLLQILDQAWKDHLYAMDQLKDSVGLRGYAEKDPRIEYKREGANLFLQMEKLVRDRVTDLIFRARLSANMQQRSVYGRQRAEHQDPGSLLERTADAAAEGTAQQREDLEAADRSGGGSETTTPMSRAQRRAAASGGGEAETPDARKQPQFKKRKKR